MATAETSNSATTKPTKSLVMHPVAPLSSSEINICRDAIQALYPSEIKLLYKQITLREPSKAELAPYLDAEARGESAQHIDRRAFIAYYIRNTDKFHEGVYNINQRTFEYHVRLGEHKHGNVVGEEMIGLEKAVLEFQEVKDAIAKLKLPEGTVVVCDPWIYGTDGIDDAHRLWQCFLYMRDPKNSSFADSNHYALPLPVSPVVRAEDYKLIRIDALPTGADNLRRPFETFHVHPPNEYTSEHQQLRTDLKPLNVIQPEGVSFQVAAIGETGEAISWQKWTFKVGFNAREGMVLYDIRYDGRPLFYRLSLSDMAIPYADPRHPFHKKAAFDLGDFGAGVSANNLQLGCDCLGSIHYINGLLSDSFGNPILMENAICVHEVDAGISWKHTNYRTGRVAIARNRELVLQSIITVANYDYILAFVFNQAGEVNYEVRATGALSTQPVNEGVDVPWGTVVHPGVLATHHQHIFCLRVDPMIDGHANRLVYDEALPMPRSDLNPHGVGYYTKETLVSQSCGLDTDYDKGRVFKIQNINSRNSINGKPAAYKIHAPPFQKIIADKDSYHYKRAEFADHNIYVVKYHDWELYAAGQWTNQSRGGEGVRSWANRREDIVDADIVVYVQFGLQHVPRIEDFPVMPAEVMKVALKPVNFFTKNPALDVPPSEQVFNRSTLAAQRHHQPATNGAVVTANGLECCGTSSKL